MRIGDHSRYSRWRRQVSFAAQPIPRLPFQEFAITQATNTGKAAHAAMSPDGKHVVGVIDDSGPESLWLRNVATGSDKCAHSR
jgi:hypothetical protein